MLASGHGTRPLHTVEAAYELVVVGGGIAGIAAAVTGAREGLRTALVNDRPVLGGNASKEIRVWIHGSEGGKNNAYFRETGLLEELRLRNLHVNPTGNVEMWNLCLLELVYGEPLLDLYLNTSVVHVDLEHRSQGEWRRVAAVRGYTAGSERHVVLRAPWFVDATGDGTVAYLAGAQFMTGREGRDAFGESLAPPEGDPFTMSGTILFQVREEDRDVPFHKPPWAYTFDEDDLRFRNHTIRIPGANFWWIEYGGIRDGIRDNEQVRDELLKIVYGIWDHLKNHPNHREANRRLALDWVGALPGKRETRRIVGDYILTERDIVEQTDFPDAVAYGGWDLDRHPPEGVFARDAYPSDRHHIPGMYNIPLRCLYARGFENLFLAGRHVSVSHVALGSTRVMVTCGQMGEAVGVAAAYCHEAGIAAPCAWRPPHIEIIQQRLLKRDHTWVGAVNRDPDDLARRAAVTASSVARLELAGGTGGTAAAQPVNPAGTDEVHQRAVPAPAAGAAPGEPAVMWRPLDRDCALMLPLSHRRVETMELLVMADAPGQLRYTLEAQDARGNTIPGEQIAAGTVTVEPGGPRWVSLPLGLSPRQPGFHFLTLAAAPGVKLAMTHENCVGVRSYEEAPQVWANGRNPYSRWAKIEGNFCFRVHPDPGVYGPENVVNGHPRPFRFPNLWRSARTSFQKPEWLRLTWPQPVEVAEVHLKFNTDLDRDLRNVYVAYDRGEIETCVKKYTLRARVDGGWRILAAEDGNYQRFRVHRFPPVRTDTLELLIHATHGHPRAEVYEIRAYPAG